MAYIPPTLKRGKCSPIELTARDKQIIQAVCRFRFLTTDQIQTLTGSTSRNSLNRRLKQLFDCKFLDRPALQTLMYSYEDERPVVHALGNEGAKFVEQVLGQTLPYSGYWTDKNKKVKDPKYIMHELGVAQCFISLQTVSGEQDGVTLIDEADIIERAVINNPRLKLPRVLKTRFQFKGDYIERDIVPDGLFSIRREQDGKGKTSFFFLEFDRNHEPLIRTNAKNQTSIVQKMLGYASVYDQNLHLKKFGYNNMRVLFVTHGKQRVENMVEAFDVHAKHAAHPNMFLFAEYEEVLKNGLLGATWVNGNGLQNVINS